MKRKRKKNKAQLTNMQKVRSVLYRQLTENNSISRENAKKKGRMFFAVNYLLLYENQSCYK